MNQETINAAYGALGKLAEMLSNELRNNVEKLESSGDSEEFQQAQKFKEAANLLEVQSSSMKKKYPHIFKE